MSDHTERLDAAERLIGSGNLKGALLALLPVLRTLAANDAMTNYSMANHTATQFVIPPGIGQQFWTGDGDHLTFNGTLRVTGDIVAGGDVSCMTMSSTEVTETKVTSADGTASYTYSGYPPEPEMTTEDYVSPPRVDERGSAVETLPDVITGSVSAPNGGATLRYEIDAEIVSALAEQGIDAVAEVETALAAEVETELAREDGSDDGVTQPGEDKGPAPAEAAEAQPDAAETDAGSEGDAAPAKRRGGRPPKAAKTV